MRVNVSPPLRSIQWDEVAVLLSTWLHLSGGDTEYPLHPPVPPPSSQCLMGYPATSGATSHYPKFLPPTPSPASVSLRFSPIAARILPPASRFPASSRLPLAPPSPAATKPIADDSQPPPLSTTALFSILSAKLRLCCNTPAPSLTCLRLDTKNFHIGVWQKRAGALSDSSWVMMVELGKKITDEQLELEPEPGRTPNAFLTHVSGLSSSASFTVGKNLVLQCRDS